MTSTAIAVRGTLIRTYKVRHPDGPLVHRSSGERNSRTGRNVRALCGASCDPETWTPEPEQPFRVCRRCDAVFAAGGAQ